MADVDLYRPRLQLGDGSSFTDPAEIADLEWLFRYGTPERREAHRFEVASALSDFLYLVSVCPTTKAAQRKLASLRRALREASDAD